jgi:hypothetical protein
VSTQSPSERRRMIAARAPSGNCSNTVIGLRLNGRLVFEHDRDVIPDRIDALALHAFQSAAIFFKQHFGLADRTNQNFEQFFADGHETASF